MRTTVNIEGSVLSELKREAERTHTSLTETVNRVLKLGLERLGAATRQAYVCPTFSMGFPPDGVADKALLLAAMLEDEEFIHKQRLEK